MATILPSSNTFFTSTFAEAIAEEGNSLEETPLDQVTGKKYLKSAIYRHGAGSQMENFTGIKFREYGKSLKLQKFLFSKIFEYTVLWLPGILTCLVITMMSITLE